MLSTSISLLYSFNTVSNMLFFYAGGWWWGRRRGWRWRRRRHRRRRGTAKTEATGQWQQAPGRPDVRSTLSQGNHIAGWVTAFVNNVDQVYDYISESSSIEHLVLRSSGFFVVIWNIQYITHPNRRTAQSQLVHIQITITPENIYTHELTFKLAVLSVYIRFWTS